MQGYEELKGTVLSVTYRNEQNGYAVVLIKCEGETVTVTGILSGVSSGDELVLQGGWKTHKVYGMQFEAKSVQILPPHSIEGILRYLSSGVIKGVGRATAQLIVERFGENTLQVIEKEPSRLAQIKGISESKAEKISEAFRSQYGLREVMNFFSVYGILPIDAARIFKVYGVDAPEIIRSNPYLLCREPIDIRFDIAEMIAKKEGIESNNVYRVMSAVQYVLRHNLTNGHTCIPRDKLITVTNGVLEVNNDDIDIAIDNLVASDELTAFYISGREFVALTEYYRAERYIATRLLMLMNFPFSDIGSVSKEIERLEKRLEINYESLQKEAIEYSLKKGLLVLTGGPGTGKTTTLKGIIDIMEQKGLKVALAAPTGRAAKRMQELTGRDAKTIHRLLEVQWDERDRQYFAKNEDNLLKADAVIIDEISMVDARLFEALLRAMNFGCRLILVGDICQLPSVGAGNIIGDIIDSCRIPVVTLQSIFRQSQTSAIITNAHKIVKGIMPDLSVRDKDFFFIEQPNPTAAATLVTDLCVNRLPKAYGYDSFEDIQVLCPSKKLGTGTFTVNNKLQKELNPPYETKPQLNYEGYTLRLGDKVMQVKNNYEIPFVRPDGSEGSGVFNGDIGIIRRFDSKSGELFVEFDDRTAKYAFDQTGDLELAYAVTVHKSQGNEYPCVIIPLTAVPTPLCFRNLIYTAVTRAKKHLIIVGSASVLEKMVENDRKTLRYTALCGLLREGQINP